MPVPVANLGPYVYVMNPYAAVPLPAPVNQNWIGVPPLIPDPVPAPVVPPNVALPRVPVNILYGLRLEEAQSQEYPGEWYFRGTERYVARALRIPYMYYRASASPGAGVALVTEHLLIGYEGAGGH